MFTSQMAPLFNINFYFDCKTKLCLNVPGRNGIPGRNGKYIFTQERFYLQRILNDINDRDTSFLNYKHEHMIKSGAPPDKVGVLYRLLPIKFHGFTKKLISKCYHSLVHGLISICLETV